MVMHRVDLWTDLVVNRVIHSFHRTYCYYSLITCNSSRRKRGWGQLVIFRLREPPRRLRITKSESGKRGLWGTLEFVI